MCSGRDPRPATNCRPDGRRSPPVRSPPAPSRPRRRDVTRRGAPSCHPMPARTCPPWDHLGLPPRHRQHRDHRHRALEASTRDLSLSRPGGQIADPGIRGPSADGPQPPCPRLRGLRGYRLEVLRERQSGSRLGRYRRRFDTCLCRILGSDQELSVVAAAPSRLARCSRLARTGQNWPSLASSSGARVGAVCRKALAKQEFERALVACVWRRCGLV